MERKIFTNSLLVSGVWKSVSSIGDEVLNISEEKMFRRCFVIHSQLKLPRYTQSFIHYLEIYGPSTCKLGSCSSRLVFNV